MPIRRPVTERQKDSAWKEAIKRAPYGSENNNLSRRGGVAGQRETWYKGALGEEVFADWIAGNYVMVCRSDNAVDQVDPYDFVTFDGYTIDVKTRGWNTAKELVVFEYRRLENPCDVYVLVTLFGIFPSYTSAVLEGWADKELMAKAPLRENARGREVRYLSADALRPMKDLIGIYGGQG